MPKRATVVINVVCLAVIAWLYGGDLINSIHGRTAAVSAMTYLPSVPFALAVLACAVGGLAWAAWGIKTGVPDSFRGYRVLPICLAVALFIDLFVIGAARGPSFSSTTQIAMGTQAFVESLNEMSGDKTVVSDPAKISAVLAQMGEPPYLVHGKRPAQFSLQVRRDCKKPVLEAPGAEVGTVLYCLGPGDAWAWVTVVGLPAEESFGEPAVFSAGGAVQWWVVEPKDPDEVPAGDGGVPAPAEMGVDAGSGG